MVMGCRVFCSQETGRFEMEKSQVRQGQMQTLKRLSFCWRVMECCPPSAAWPTAWWLGVPWSQLRWSGWLEPEGGVTQVGGGLVTEGEVGVVGPPSERFDGNSHTLGDIGLHARPGQPQLSVAEQMLAGGGTITDE